MMSDFSPVDLKSRIFSLLLRSALLTMFTAGLALAQFNCSMVGVVTDSSGAIVAEASVQVTNVDTGIRRDVNTGGDGSYRVLSLSPGLYEVAVTATGFQPMQRRDIRLGVPETARVDFRLQVGSNRETVTVTAAESEIETEKSGNFSVFTQQAINSIPTNGNNVYDLWALPPGVSGRASKQSGGPNASAPFGSHPTVTICASGAQRDSNNFPVNGVSASGVDGGTVVIQPNPDSVAELEVNSTRVPRSLGATAARR
jgi:hypothetical protein